MSALPTVPGGFGCILADPPWQFETRDGAPDSLPTCQRIRTAQRQPRLFEDPPPKITQPSLFGEKA